MEWTIEDEGKSGVADLLEAEQIILERARAVSQSIVNRVHEVSAEAAFLIQDRSDDSPSLS